MCTNYRQCGQSPKDQAFQVDQEKKILLSSLDTFCYVVDAYQSRREIGRFYSTHYDVFPVTYKKM